MNAITFSADYFKRPAQINLHMLHGLGVTPLNHVKLSANLRIKPSVSKINCEAVIRFADSVAGFVSNPRGSHSIFKHLWPSERCRSINQIMNEIMNDPAVTSAPKQSIFRWFATLGTRPLNINLANVYNYSVNLCKNKNLRYVNCHFTLVQLNSRAGVKTAIWSIQRSRKRAINQRINFWHAKVHRQNKSNLPASISYVVKLGPP